MAARQDQSQIVSLIICAILIIAFGGLSYWFYSEWSKADARAKELATQKSNADNAARESLRQAETYLEMLGFDRATPFTDVQSRFDEDQKRYMENYSEDSRTYRSVLESLYTENATIAQQESEAKAREKEIKARMIALKAEYDAQLAEKESQLADKQRDLASERVNFNEGRRQLEKQRQELTQQLASTRDELQKKVDDALSKQAEAEKNLVGAERARDRLLEQRTLDSPSFEKADGLVTYANQSNSTVWINLGEADDLRRQVTFSVFESGLSDAGKAEKKGSIEVIRLMGDHLAEARVTWDDPKNPILPGDQIYSQIWQRGKKLRFALTGLIDLDGDGSSDLQRAKDLIALNGAEVDASLEEDGTVDGEMTVETRFLVLGSNPDQPSKAFLRKGYQSMSDDAATLGIDTITLNDFLAQMGYRSQTKTARSEGDSRRSGSGGGRPTSYRFGR